MSVSSSAPSTHTSPSSWGLNDRLVSLMESIYAIIAGLGLRYVVDTVSRHDFKITGTLVGLWEGVILLHFSKKLPKSTDPYLAFAVRLFIDFVVTESVSRLVLVLTWTGMGMILADVAPAIWEDIGLRRVWRRFRRDLYIMSESVPTVVFFPPTRTVRFSPSREPSVIAEEEEEPNADAHTEARSVESSTSAGVTEQDTANIEPPIRRRLPGYFPGMLSDTESVASSIVSRDIRLPSTLQRDSERTSRRLSVYPMTPVDHDFASETSSQRNEEDEIKLSSSTSSQSTVTGPADTTRFTDDIRITEDFDTTQLTDIPDELVEEHKPAETTQKETVKKDPHPELETTLKPPSVTLFLPPTPSDSQPPHRRRLPKDDQPRPPSALIPQIPDMPEELPSDGWENIQKEDANDVEFPWEQVQREDVVDADRPPPPPPKDWHDMSHLEQFLTTTTSTNTNDRAGLGGTSTTNEEHRYSQPPPYVDHVDDHDDIYEDHPSDAKVSGAVAGGSSNPGLADLSTLGDRGHIDEMRISRWLEQDAAERRRQEEAEAERRRLEEEAAEQKRQKEAAEKRRKDEEETKRRLEEEAEQKRKEEEKKRQKEAAEQRRKDEEEAKRRLEEEEAEKRRIEEERIEKETKRVEEEKKRQEEAAEQRRKDEQAKKRLEEEEAAKRRTEEAVKREKQEELEKERIEEEAAAESRRQKEAEQRRKEQELEEKKRQEAAAETLRKDEATRKRLEENEAEKRRIENEAAERKRLEGEATEQNRNEGAAAEIQETESPKEQEAEQQISEEDTHLKEEEKKRQAEISPIPSTPPLAETQGDDGQKSVEIVNEDAGKDEPDAGEQHRMETESVATDQSTIPADVESRLSRILLTKAQIVKIQSRIDELGALLDGTGDEGTRHEWQHAQKVLEKLKRKDQRRRDEATPLQLTPGLSDRDDYISFGVYSQSDAKTRLLEKLEELLVPGATSLFLTVDYGPKRVQRHQKQAVTEVLTEFELLDQSSVKGRQTIIDVTPEHFSEWLTKYRASVTRPE